MTCQSFFISVLWILCACGSFVTNANIGHLLNPGSSDELMLTLVTGGYILDGTTSSSSVVLIGQPQKNITIQIQVNNQLNTMHTYGMYYGDGFGSSICTNTPAEISHGYATTGQYTFLLVVFNTNGMTQANFTVDIIDPLPKDLFSLSIVTTQNYVVENVVHPLSALRDMTLYPSQFYLYTECVFSDNNQPVFTNERGNLTVDNTTFTRNFTFVGAATHNLSFHCDNYISSLTVSKEVLVYERVKDIKLALLNTINSDAPNGVRRLSAKVDTTVTGKINSTYSGPNIITFTYIVDWGEGQNTNLYISHGGNLSKSVSHKYNNTGFYQPYVYFTDDQGTKVGNLTFDTPPLNTTHSGVYIWPDYCLICIEIAVTNPSSGALFTKTTATVSLALTIANTTAPDKIPPQLVCNWTAPTGMIATNPATPLDPTLDTVINQDVPLTYNPNSISQNVEVSCSTPLGPQIMTQVVRVGAPLEDVTVEADTPDGFTVLMNKVVTFIVKLVGGEIDLSFGVNFNNDTTEVIFCCEVAGRQLYFNHTFTTLGLMTLTVSAVDGDNNERNITMSVLVVNPVVGLTLTSPNHTTLDNITLIFPDLSLTYNISVTDEPGVSNLPSNVTCIENTAFGTKEIGDMSLPPEGSVLVTGQLTYIQGQAAHNVTFNCSNGVSYQILESTVEVLKSLENLSMALLDDSKYYYAMDTPVEFIIYVDGGYKSVGFSIHFGYTTEVVTVTNPACNLTVTHNFMQLGSFNVSVVAKDQIRELTANLSSTIHIQRAVNDSIALFGPSFLLYPSIMTGTYNIGLLPGFLPPSDVNCTYSLPSSIQSFIVSTTDTWLNHTGVTHTFDFIDGVDEAVSVYCENRVSNFTEQIYVHINRSLANLTLTVAPQHEQTALVPVSSEVLYVNCSSVQCWVPNNNIKFLVNGSYGDMPIKYNFSMPYVNMLEDFKPSHEDFDKIIPLTNTTIGITALELMADEYTIGQVHSYTLPLTVQQGVGVMGAGVSNFIGPSTVTVPFSYTYTLTLDLRSALSTAATCIWTSPSGIEQLSMYDGSTGFSSTMNFYQEQGRNQTITVNCSNSVSHIVRTHMVQTLFGISDVKLSIDTTWKPNYCQTSVPCNFDVTAMNGEGTNIYNVHANGDEIYSDTKTPHVNFTFSHVFVNPGTYELSIVASDSIGNTTFGPLLVYVQQALQDVVISTTNTPGTIPDGLVMFQLTHVASVVANHQPSNVTCDLSLPGGDTVVNQLTFQNENVNTLSRTLASNVPIGLHTTNMTCSNQISTASSSTQFLMMEKITGLNITADKTIVAENEIVTFTITRLTGTGVTYTVNYMDSTPDDIIATGDNTDSRQATHAFAVQNWYNITVNASNAAESVAVQLGPVYYIDVQQMLKNLVLVPVTTPPQEAAIENAFQSPLAHFKIQPDLVLGIPSTVFFDWDFGDGNSLLNDIPTAWSSGHPISHTYDATVIGQVNVTVRAYNNVSEQQDGLSVIVSLVEPVSGLTATLSHRYAAPGQRVFAYIQVTKGSHLTFACLNYSRTDPTNVTIRYESFRFTYNKPGDLWVPVTVENLYGNTTMEILITIQKIVPDFNMTSLGPVLTPPGEIQIEVMTSGAVFKADDMNCTWHFSDGPADVTENFPLGSNTILSQPTLPYTPSGHSILTEIQLTLSCSNIMTPVAKTSTANITIIPNPVILGKMKNDGPKQYNETLQWTLQIKSYGNNSCFVWTFPNISHIVLFGTTECQGKYSHTEFISVTTPQTQLTYSRKFNIGEIIVVNVHAENSISSDNVTNSALVLLESCDPPVSSVGTEGQTLTTTRIVHFSDPISVFGSTITKCSYPFYFILSWKVYEYDLVQNDVGRIVMSAVLPKKADLNIMPRVLPLGQYYVELTSVMKGLPVDVPSEAFMYLKIVRTPLHAEIMGSRETVVSTIDSTEVLIDGWTMSHDPDMGNNSNKAEISWKWHCMKTSTVNPTGIMVNWTAITQYDSGDCTTPTSGLTKAGYLSLKSSELVIGQKYAITVMISKPDGRVSTFTQVITSQSSSVIALETSCVYNCKKYVNNQRQLKLRGSCGLCSSTDAVTFTWSFAILNTNTHTFQATVLANNVTIVQDQQDVIIEVPPNTFVERETYRLILQATTSSGLIGLAVYEIVINKAPYNGTCVVDYARGNVLLTKFTVICNGWQDTEEQALASQSSNRRKKRSTAFLNAPNLNFQVLLNATYMQGSPYLMLLTTRNSQTPSMFFPLGNPSNNYTLPLYALAVDSYGSSSVVQLNTANVPQSNVTWLQFMLEIKKNADAGDIQSTLQMISTFVSLLELGVFENIQNVTEQEKQQLYTPFSSPLSGNIINLKSYMLTQLGKLKPEFPNELEQVNKVMRMLTAQNGVFSPSDASSNSSGFYAPMIAGISLLNQTASSLKDVAPQMSKEQLTDICSDAVFNVGQLLKVMSDESRRRLSFQCNPANCTGSIEQDIESTLKQHVALANDILDKINEAMLEHAIPGEAPLVFDTPELVMVSQKITLSMLAGASFSSRLGSLTMATNTSVYDSFTATCIDVNYVAYTSNPYVWSANSVSINQPTQQIRMRDCITRELQIPMNTTDDDQYSGFTVISNPAVPVENETVLTDIKTQLAFHTIDMTDIETDVQVFFEIHDAIDVSLTLFIKFEGQPNINDFDFTTVLPRGMPEVIPTDRNLRMEYIGNATNNFTTNVYSFVIPKSVTSKLGQYTIGVLVSAFDDAGVEMTQGNYTFSIRFVTCKLWVEELNKWLDRECLVMQDSNGVRIVFVSRVFPSSFGAGFDVGPNTIDFGSVFQDGLKKLLENIHVLVVIVLFYLIFVAIVPIAYKFDRIDGTNWAPVPLIGFNPDHKYQYTVDIYTGFQSKAGTDSNVFFFLVGTERETKPIFITSEQRKNFQRGSMNRFILSSKKSLGLLRYICIGHDCAGKGDKQDWYLEKINVKDERSNKNFCFLCDKWLSLEKGNGSVEAILKLVSKYQLLEFKGMVKKRASKAVLEDNLWVSTFFRREEDPFTRVQRVTVAISLVFLTMVSNAMWYRRGNANTTNPTGFQIGPFSFTLQTLIVSTYSVLTVLPPTLLILLFFTKSKPRKQKHKYLVENDDKDTKNEGSKQALVQADEYLNLNSNNNNSNTDDINCNNNSNSSTDDESEPPTQKKTLSEKFSGRFLPFWCVYFGWLLCLAAMTVSPFFTILYSFTWGGTESAQWLSAFCLSFFQSEGLISPVKAIMLALLISLICKKPVDTTDDYGEDYDDHEFSEDGKDPLAAEKLAQMRYRRWLANEVHKAIKMFIWHALFLLCLTFVVIGNRDPNSFLLNNEMKNVYYTEALEVKSQADFWTYMKDTAAPNMYWLNHDNGAPVTALEKMFLVNGVSRRLGAPVLRQFRVKDVHCGTVTPLLKPLKCDVDYFPSTEDKRDFLTKWKYPNVNTTLPANPTGIPRAFTYDQGDPTNYYYEGYYTTYNGRGYSLPLGVTVQETNTIITELIQDRWLDRYTRAVVLEFNSYNANVNLFNLFSVFIEFPTVGAALVRKEVRAVKLYRYIGGLGVFSLVSELIVVIFVIALTVRLIYHVVKQKWEYFMSIVNLLEVVKLLCGLLGISLYVLRTLMIQNAVTYMMNNQNEYANFRGVALVDMIFVFSMGFAMFIQILQVMWVFKFNRTMSIFGGTLRYSKNDLLGFLLVVACIFMAFFAVHYIFYGPKLWGYRDFINTTYSMLTSMLGKFRTAEFETGAGMFGRVLFVTYTSVMIFIYINLLIVIITDVYESVRTGETGGTDQQMYKAIDLLTEKVISKD